MKAKVLGIQKVDYVSRKTGNSVVGTTLHVSFKDSDVVGESVDNIFISDNLGLKDVLSSIKLGTMVGIEYNRRGFVSDVAILGEK